MSLPCPGANTIKTFVLEKNKKVQTLITTDNKQYTYLFSVETTSCYVCGNKFFVF